MPIKKENKAKYPKNWKEIRADILKRAKNCCEFCKKPNKKVMSSDEGHWFDQEAERWRDRKGEQCETPMVPIYQVKTVLTVAHLDHNPENNAYENLRALCQRCHNVYDAEHRKGTRAKTMAKKKESQSEPELTLPEKRDAIAQLLGDKAAEKKAPEIHKAMFDAEVKAIARTNGGGIKLTLVIPYNANVWQALGFYSGSIACVSMVSKQAALDFAKKQTQPTTQAELEKAGKTLRPKNMPKRRPTPKGRPKGKPKAKGKSSK